MPPKKVSLTPALKIQQQIFQQATNVHNPSFQQAVNTSLPPPTPTEQQPSTASTWNSTQLRIIEDHVLFHQNFIQDLNKLKNDGPNQSGKLPKLPTQPKRKLKELYDETGKKTKRTRTPLELHEYLKSNEISTSMKVRKEVFFFKLEEITSAQTSVSKLMEGYRQIQRQNSTSLFFFIQYGGLLEVAFSFFEAEKKAGTQSEMTWDDWLKKHIGICPTYSRRLREIHRLLKPYQSKFSSIGLSFHEIFSIKGEIKAMFDSSEQIRNYWMQEGQRIFSNDEQILSPSINQP